MPIPLPPLPPVGSPQDLITVQVASYNSTLAALAISNPTYLAYLITSASDAIENFCNRSFWNQSYSELYSGAAYPGQCLQLRQRPITSISRVACYPDVAIVIQNNNTAVSRSTVATTSTGIVLVSVASGVTTTTTLLYSNYITIGLLGAAVNAVSGWNATVQPTYNTWASSDIAPLQGAVNSQAPNGGASLIVYLENLVNQWSLDPDAAHLYGWFPQGGAPSTAGLYGSLFGAYACGQNMLNNILVQYSAGYTIIPNDLQEACRRLTVMLYEQDQRDVTISETKIGPYFKKYDNFSKSLLYNPNVYSLLCTYVDYANTLGTTSAAVS